MRLHKQWELNIFHKENFIRILTLMKEIMVYQLSLIFYQN